MISDLNDRSREIFRRIVDAYMTTGGPVGSRTLSKQLAESLSPASVRNVMADLEELGLLYAPHISAGRIPTEAGLRLFVDGLLEVGNVSNDERETLEGHSAAEGKSVEGLLEEVTSTLSGLAGCASLVAAPKTEAPLKHIEFVALSPGRTLVVMVVETGVVENRIIETPRTLPPSALIEATNYLSAKLVGRTVHEALKGILKELDNQRTELNLLTTKVVEAGLATWAGNKESGTLIVRGQSHLLEDVAAVSDLERIRNLFEALETKESLLKLLEKTEDAQGVQIFIGADNQLFDMAGCSMVVAPFHNTQERIIGAIGVVGPTRINYARIIPMVDFTAKLIGRRIG